jgi:acyl-CoA reductase-like NAD-dependent aldehyde dehydrogenase
VSDVLIVRSPFDGSEVGEAPRHTSDDVASAAARAHAAFRSSDLPAWRRHEVLLACARSIEAYREDLARTIRDEAAKPIGLARAEVDRARSTFTFAAAEALRVGGELLPMSASEVSDGKLGYVTRVPRGVVGAISPFNFPLNLVAHKVAPAIAAGCPVVLKPASQTPLSSLALARILYDAGLPEPWLHVVVGSGSEVGNALVEHPDVPTISFTGSSVVGWNIPRLAPRKHIGLELGNSTPLIVHADSDWHSAATKAVAAGFGFAGQSCISVQRIYVHKDIAEPFAERLTSLARALPTGDPADEATVTSALISEAERDRVRQWVDDAISQGADLLCGNDIDGNVLVPTVLARTTLQMDVAREEVFGPVVAIQEYDTFDEALALANGTRYGLQAGVYTGDLTLALRATRELEFGGVLVNEIPTWRADLMPYGGVKDSGNTREGPKYAVEQMMERRLAVITA